MFVALCISQKIINGETMYFFSIFWNMKEEDKICDLFLGFQIKNASSLHRALRTQIIIFHGAAEKMIPTPMKVFSWNWSTKQQKSCKCKTWNGRFLHYQRILGLSQTISNDIYLSWSLLIYYFNKLKWFIFIFSFFAKFHRRKLRDNENF